jgi:hypothetical protein
MTLYVDDHKFPFGRMKMSHLFSIPENAPELEQFAGRLGLKREWKHHNHYDVCLSLRQRAIKLGAVPITMKEAGKLINASRKAKEEL